MLKLLSTILFMGILSVSFAQITLFQDDFEGIDNWTRTGDLTPNSWILNNCTAQTGSSLYINGGGTVAGCGVSGTESYGYTNATSGNTFEAIAFTTINASCVSSVNVSFDYQIDGALNEDFLELIYSTDGGSTWIATGGQLVSSTGWNNTSVTLPSALAGTSFLLGFRFTYDDAIINGNPAAIDNVVVTGVDTIAPIVVCPADTNLYVDNFCNSITPDFTDDVVATDNCTATNDLIINQSPAPFTPNTDTTNVLITISVTDEAGVLKNCSFTMRVLDTIPTQINCPTDSNVYVNNSCGYVISDFTDDAILQDNCQPTNTLTVTQSVASGTTIYSDQTITLTVTGGEPSLPQSCSFNLQLIDTITPGIVCPTGSPLYTDNSCNAILPDFTSSALVVDNCTFGTTITQSPAAGSTVNTTVNQLITLTISDTAGNSSSCNMSIPVFDTISPTIICPSNQIEYSNASCQGILSDYKGLVTPSDNCSTIGNLVLTQNPASGTTISSTQIITIQVEDESGNTQSCSFNVDLVDTIAPSVSCPSNLTLALDNNCSHALGDYTSSTVASDNCSSSAAITLTQNPVSGSVLSAGTHTISILAEDESGNIDSCSFTLTLNDQTAPVFTNCPSTQTVFADVNCSGLLGDYTSTPTITDNCSSAGQITVSQSPAVGTTISNTTLITLTATDANGNTSTCQFNAVLNDTISPSIICANDSAVNINSGCSYTIPDLTGDVSGSDNCSVFGNMTVTQNPAAGTTGSNSTVVLLTLTDENGNSTTCTANVTPIDTVAPTITCPNPAPENVGSACDFTLTNYGTQALVLDNCSNFTITQSPAVGTTVPTGTTTITLTATDGGSNSATCTFDLQVIENVAPIINCPPDTTSCDPVMFYTMPTFSDNCLATIAQTDQTGYTYGSTFPIGMTLIEYTAIDSSGNSSSCIFRVDILDFPSQANITEDTIALCGSNTGVLNADPATSGTGEWSIISGSGNFNNEFASTTGVNNLGTGTNVFAWTISSASCGFTSDTVVVIVSENPGPATISEDTIYACSNSSLLLQANPPLSGTSIWTTNSNTSISNPTANSTAIGLNDAGWSQFYFTVSNDGCPSVSDSVAVYFSPANYNVATSDSNICIEDAVTVQLTSSAIDVNETVNWYFIAGDGYIQNPNAANTGVKALSSGLNYIVHEREHEFCPTYYDTVRIAVNLCNGFNPVFPTLITPNYDGKNDVFTIDFLNQIYPDCEVIIFNRWGSVVFESNGYAEPWDGTRNGEPLPIGTYFYKIMLNDEDGTVYTGDISVLR